LLLQGAVGDIRLRPLSLLAKIDDRVRKSGEESLSKSLNFLDFSSTGFILEKTIGISDCAQDKLTEGVVRVLPFRVCDFCDQPYWPNHPTQRWCSPACREEFRNCELRAARKLWRKAGTKEILEECKPQREQQIA
jgi:hypothetical protein